jgi:hypothetical protein
VLEPVAERDGAAEEVAAQSHEHDRVSVVRKVLPDAGAGIGVLMREASIAAFSAA